MIKGRGVHKVLKPLGGSIEQALELTQLRAKQ